MQIKVLQNYRENQLITMIYRISIFTINVETTTLYLTHLFILVEKHHGHTKEYFVRPDDKL